MLLSSVAQRRMGSALAAVLSLTIIPSIAVAQPTLVNTLVIPGNATDLNPGSGANTNRLSVASDLFYDRVNNVYYGMPDRGAGGGTLSYETRVQKFTLDVNANSGAISNFNVIDTILLKDTDGTTPFNGLNPLLLNGNSGTLGNSLDPEGLAVGGNGHLFISDEYGPSVYEFGADGVLIRKFTTPDNLLPRTAGNALDFVSGRPTITTGRQDNRGYEGLALSKDGTKLYAVLQDPLVNEGALNDGRRSQNVRLVEYDISTGQGTRQFVYQLESLSSINSRINNDFGATAQGRNIGLSAIVPLTDTKFLVLERDNRGLGVDDPLGAGEVGTKRLYLIDIAGATDVTALSLAGSNALPNGVTPVSKQLYLDIQAALVGAGVTGPEKIEGVTFGPTLTNGRISLLIGTDNDFSLTQNTNSVQFDVYTNGVETVQVPIDTPGPAGFSLIPTFLFGFATTAPEPGTFFLLSIGGIACAALLRRR